MSASSGMICKHSSKTNRQILFVLCRNILEEASYHLSYLSAAVIITDSFQLRYHLPAWFVIPHWTESRPSFIKYTTICQSNNQFPLDVQLNHSKLL